MGGEVREAIADGIEVVEQLRKDYDNQVINAGNSNSEIVDARGGQVKLKDRLDKFDSHLAEKANNSDLLLTNNTIDIIKTKEVNVLDFGADNTGIRLSCEAIQNAINSLINGGTVFIPSGIYKIDKTILVNNNVHIKGGNRLTTLIYPSTQFRDDMISGTLGDHISLNMIANSNFSINGNGDFQSNYNITISNISFIFDNTRLPLDSDKANVIGFYNSRNIKVYNCYSKNFSQHLVDLTSCEECECSNNTTINHYWSSFQVDGGDGIYQGGISNTQQSNNILIKDNIISSAKSDRGGIQIHKVGGNNVKILNNIIKNSLVGISTDDYYTDNWNLGELNNLIISDNIVTSDVLNSKGISIGMNGDKYNINNNYIYVKGVALQIKGGKPNFYTSNVNILNNKLFGTHSIIEGITTSNITNNSFKNGSQKTSIIAQNTVINNNTIENNGLLFTNVVRTDPRDSLTYNYYFNYIICDNNKFINNTGDAYSYELIATDFREVTLNNTIYFDRSKKFKIDGFTVNSGLILNDFNTTRKRTVGSTSRPGSSVIGQMVYDESIKKPIWYDGSNWKDASGQIV